MDVVTSGFIPGTYPGSGEQPGYCLLDTGDAANTASEVLQMMMDRTEGVLQGQTASGSQSDHTIYLATVPSLWQDLGYGTSVPFQTVDVGFGFTVAGFAGNDSSISFSNGKAVNNYSRVRPTYLGGLFLCLSPGNEDWSGSYVTKAYSTGVLIECTFNSRGNLYIYFTNTQEVFFFHTVNMQAPFGFMAPGTNFVNIVGYCSPYKLYCLKSVVSIVSGVVKNAVGQPAPNCKVFMFRRSDGKMLGKAISDEDGNYLMQTLANRGDEVFMVCLDDDEAPDFEALIYDRVTV